MNKRKIIIDLMMTNNCNRRCEYCPINFTNNFLEKEDIDFLINYLLENTEEYDFCTINFFGGEPLLNFENIKYFIENNLNDKIDYTIGTNGMLLTEDILNFFVKYNVKIFLTFHADFEKTYKSLLGKKFLSKGIDLININFIASPRNIDFLYEKLNLTVDFGFKHINIIPVMLTIEWDNQGLINLMKFINYVDNNYIKNNEYNYLKIGKYSYFDGIPKEIGFVINTNLNIYQDSSDELYIGKQFKALGDDLLKKVEDFTLIGNIKDIKLEQIISKYDIKNIVKLLYSFPKKLGYLKTYAVIYRIMNNNVNNRNIMNGNIYDFLVNKKI
ncbi:MAG: radical SAM protein [Candidatus Gracilibacteria bacterium]|nr:radical SAM protein [Candidatus Gracilibacteria bacterium]